MSIRSSDTNRTVNVGENAGPMPQSAHFQSEDEVKAELIARADSLPEGSTSRAAILARLRDDFGIVRRDSTEAAFDALAGKKDEWGNPK
jgi:hypothetical protein